MVHSPRVEVDSQFLDCALNWLRKIYRIVVLFTVLAVSVSCRAAALNLIPDEARPDIAGELQFLADGDLSLTAVIAAFRRGEFSSDPAVFQAVETGFEPVWIALELVNDSTDDGRAPDEWILTSDKSLLAGLDAYLIRENGLTENVLDFDNSQAFDPEISTVTGLRSNALALRGGERALLIVRYQAGLIRSIRLGLQTRQSLADKAVAAGVGFAAFYAFSVAGLLFFLGFNISMRNRLGLYYTGLFALGLIFLAYIDGFLFRFFWPEHPIFNIHMGNVIFLAMSGFGLFVASRSFLDDGRETIWSRSALGLASFAVLIIAMIPVFGFRIVNFLIVPIDFLFALMFAANIAATARWRRSEGSVHIFSNFTSVLAAIVVVILVVMVLGGYGLQIVPVHIVAKLIYAVVTLTTMIGLTAHIVALRRAHQTALDRELEALEQEAETSRALLDAEKNYSRARELAQLRQKQLARASHDLKQPLASLRMTMDTIAESRAPEVRARLREAFDYMEGLTTSYLRETRPDDVLSDPQPANAAPANDGDGKHEAETEPYEIALVLKTVRQMFHEEAVSKGLRLRMVNSTATVTVPPLVLMRIVSNLVSNAVKYTECGTVLFGVRRADGRARIEVHDTGPGMSRRELADLLQPYRKGEESEGEGLGLAICRELAGTHGLDFQARSDAGRGTCFQISIPVAAGQ